MNIFVCVKYVPDPTVVNRIDPATKRLVREGVIAVLDPGDEYGVEAGLELVEKHGGSVTVVSMGPLRASEGIRKAFAMGADRGILITDSRLVGSDSLSTAKALAAALKKEEFDIVLCGTESTDASTGMVPGQLAELLGIPHLTFATHLEVKDNKAVVHRQTEYGYQVVEAPLPVLVTVTGAIGQPRYPSLPKMMEAKRKPIAALDTTALGLLSDQVGEAGAKEKVLALADPEPRQAGPKVEDGGKGGILIADFLQKNKLV